MIIKKITTIASVAALAVSATTLGAIKANASNAYERALLASGASELEAVVISRPRTSGAPITRRTLEIRQANILAIKELGTEENYLAEIQAEKAAQRPLRSAFDFLAGGPAEHADFNNVFGPVYTTGGRPYFVNEQTTRNLINLMLHSGVGHALMGDDYMNEAEAAYTAWVNAGTPNPTAQNIQDYLNIAAGVTQVANRALFVLGEAQNPTNRALYG
ncbi:MAG TPA: hypothetical protein DD412_06005, partial [Holosporales bacterium]|nr:hypothetical protein [Holosporales bacterium]